mmetsp:Transcript_70872/g.153929  ORF Transcript_70872/g.153929 Transcript_70872/m.153929 type:complete len:214 (+) Transcript_70872:321-962(+)
MPCSRRSRQRNIPPRALHTWSRHSCISACTIHVMKKKELTAMPHKTRPLRCHFARLWTAGCPLERSRSSVGLKTYEPLLQLELRHEIVCTICFDHGRIDSIHSWRSNFLGLSKGDKVCCRGIEDLKWLAVQSSKAFPHRTLRSGPQDNEITRSVIVKCLWGPSIDGLLNPMSHIELPLLFPIDKIPRTTVAYRRGSPSSRPQKVKLPSLGMLG